KSAFASGNVLAIGGRHGCARRELRTLSKQALFQGCQEDQYVVRPTRVPHQPDTPRLAFELTQAAADLDPELTEQPLAGGQVINAAWDAHRVQHGQLMTLHRRVANADGRQTRLQRL